MAERRTVGTDREVGAVRVQTDAVAQVTGDRHAVLALHGDHGSAIVLQDTLCETGEQCQ